MISFLKAKALKKFALLTMGAMFICFITSPITAAEKEPFTPLGAHLRDDALAKVRHVALRERPVRLPRLARAQMRFSVQRAERITR